MSAKRNKHTGIEIRHAQACPAGGGEARCSCSPTYRAEVFSARENRKLRKTFPTLAQAKA